MAYERKDIRLEPVYPWMYFGDGYMGQVISLVQGRDNDGEDVWEVILIPTEELAKKYNITLDQLDENLSLSVNYPYEFVVQLSFDPVYPVYFNFLKFDGTEAPATKFWKGYQEKQKIDNLNRFINHLKAQNAYLTEQLEKAKTNIRQFIKEEIMGPAGELSSQLLSQQQTQVSGPVRSTS